MKETNKEISNANFGDKRLNKRMELILESLTKSPVSSIPEACKTMAETKGAYRFFDSDKVKVKDIQEFPLPQREKDFYTPSNNKFIGLYIF